MNRNAVPQILALSPDWLVLDKPAGWLTIEGRTAPGAVPAPVIREWAAATHAPVWIVHRLDRETSGVLLLARTEDAHRRANQWFSAHQIKKAYDCLASGAPPAPVFKVKTPIEGAASLTQFEVRERYAHAFRARAIPQTGRRHQIRIHLAAEGCPLLGDVRYGGPPEFPRVALHAARLELPTGEVFEAPLPEDLARKLAELRA